jgi:ATP-binding cassette subfamily B protein
MDGKTALIISHRVGFCRLADKIIVMDGGRIFEEGCHDELMKLNGNYHRMFTSQAGWYI